MPRELIERHGIAFEDAQPIIALIMVTVILSVLLHGVTARPLARRYGEQATNLEEDKADEPPKGAGSLRPRHLGEHSERA